MLETNRWEWLGLPIFEAPKKANGNKERSRSDGWPLNLRCLGLPDDIGSHGEAELDVLEEEPKDLFDVDSVIGFKNDLQTIVAESAEPAAKRLRTWVGRLHVHSLERSLMHGEATYSRTKNRLLHFEVLIDCVLLSDMTRYFDKVTRILKHAA